MAKPAKPVTPEKTEAHKPEVAAPKKHADHATPPASKTKGHAPMPGGCLSWGCKISATRFNFCDEHYDHFKFGLVKKTGEPVSDFEKKFEHYLAHKTKRGVQKVA